MFSGKYKIGTLTRNGLKSVSAGHAQLKLLAQAGKNEFGYKKW